MSTSLGTLRIRSRDLVRRHAPGLLNLLRPQPTISVARHVKDQRWRFSAPVRVDGKQTFLLLVTHSPRPVDFERCSLNFLTRRYDAATRLSEPPPFEELPPLDPSTSGGVSVFELSVFTGEIELKCLNYIVTEKRVQHATVVGSRLVLCFEHGLYVSSCDLTEIDGTTISGDERNHVHDPWFGGLHTVFPMDEETCVVSSSGADAVLFLNLRTRSVTRRLRLPSELYGSNYPLRESDSVVEHYVHNDLQLAHLNCAYPGPDGRVFVSTLIQGDIGYFDEHGRYERIHTGSVGCHGVRVARNGQYLYFADSCLGVLHLIDFSGRTIRRYHTGSRWLHDVRELADDVFIFSLADENAIAIIDTASDSVLFRRQLDDLGTAVQFLSLRSISA